MTQVKNGRAFLLTLVFCIAWTVSMYVLGVRGPLLVVPLLTWTIVGLAWVVYICICFVLAIDRGW